MCPHHDDRDRTDRDRPPERLPQQQEEGCGREHGREDADRKERIALEAIEVERDSNVAKDPAGLATRRQQRLVRGARRGRHDRHEQDAQAGEQRGAHAFRCSSPRPLAHIHDDRR